MRLLILILTLLILGTISASAACDSKIPAAEVSKALAQKSAVGTRGCFAKETCLCSEDIDWEVATYISGVLANDELKLSAKLAAKLAAVAAAETKKARYKELARKSKIDDNEKEEILKACAEKLSE